MSARRPPIIGCAVALLFTTGWVQAITIANLSHNSAHWRGHAECAGETPGGTDLAMGGDVGYWHSSSLGGIVDALNWQFGTTTIHLGDGNTAPRDPANTWSFALGNDLAGRLTVDHYQAYDTHSGGSCRHGAEFSCNYLPAGTDPTHVAWVQLFEASYDKRGVAAGTLLVDPFPNDGGDDAPFYFSDVDNPQNYYFSNPEQPVPAGALIFGDQPGASHDESQQFTVWLRLNLFLVSWEDADPHSLTIHDGIRWGYDGYCVPETMNVMLCAMVAVALLCWRPRRGHAPTQSGD